MIGVTSNYNGDMLGFLYLVLSVGNEVVAKGATRLLTGISKKRSLPKLSQTTDPIGDYTTGVPGTDTVTTTYEEVTIEPQKMTLYEEFDPEDLQDLWDKWQPNGDFTNLRQNEEFQRDVIALYMNGSGRQVSKLFFQGDTTLGAGNALNKLNGLVTRAKSDANVIAVTPAGNITSASVSSILSACWSAIPNHLMDDPRFILMLSTQDWRILQLMNSDTKKANDGILDDTIKNLFLSKRIVHFEGMPKNYILGMLVDPNSDESNSFMGAYVQHSDENPLINKKDNAGRIWFTRIDWKLDANYRESSEVVFYEPA